MIKRKVGAEYYFRPVYLPKNIPLRKSAKELVRQAERKLHSLAADVIDHANLSLAISDRHSCEKYFRCLRHPLSPFAQLNAPVRGADGYRSDRFREEAAIFKKYHIITRNSLNLPSSDEFVRTLLEVNRSIMGENSNFRRGTISTVRDRHGICWVYPGPEFVPKSLRDLHHYLHTSRDSPLIKASVAHVAIAICHPFSDGNGRLARIIFAAILSSRDTYLPIGLISNLCMHGYEIRVRLSNLNSDWEDMIVFFAELVLAYYRFSCRRMTQDIAEFDKRFAPAIS